MKFSPIISICFLLITAISHAKIYKWTDEHGQTHYSDVKPQNVQKVEEPLSKIKDLKSNVTTADIEKYLIGTWKIPDQKEENNGMTTQVKGNATFHSNGKVSFDIKLTLNGRKFDGVEMAGNWYLSNKNHLNVAVTTTIYGNANTSNNTEVIIKINENIMTSIDQDGKKSTLYRIR